MTEAYREALKEHDIRPLTQPTLDAPQLQVGQPYHFTVTVPILTPVELGDYRSLHFDREETGVTSEEVESELALLRNRKATWETVERPAQVNDRATVDLRLTVEGEQVSDLKDNPFELTGERHGIYTGMDEQIVGMQPGESKNFTTTIPEDYNNEKLAGKEASYEVTLHKIEVKQLPELDDAFASSISSYPSLEDLRKAISDEIEEDKKRRASNELREKVIDAVVERSQVTAHPVLVKDEAEDMLHRLSHLLENQHVSLDQYLLMMRKTREEYLEETAPEAEKQVKRDLVLDAIADQEQIEVQPEELEQLVRAYSSQGQQLNENQLGALLVSYRRQKAMSHLLELVAGPDPDAEESDEEAAEVVEEEQPEANAEAAARVDTTEEPAAGAIVESHGSATMNTEETPADTRG